MADFKLKLLQRELDIITKRLSSSVTYTELLNWLGNFEENEKEYVLELLSLFDYITSDDIFERYYEHFSTILSRENEKKIVVHPIGKYGKSGTAMMYYAKKAIEETKQKDRFDFVYDIKNYIDGLESLDGIVFVFIDDIFGSGDSTIEYFNERIRDGVNSKSEQATIYFVSIITMSNAKGIIEQSVPRSIILTEIREKVFTEGIGLIERKERIRKIKDICRKYAEKGGKLYLKDKNFKPFGYKDSQALIAFSYGTPNNTIPIFWGNRQGWFPLFPRFLSNKVSRRKEYRREIAQWISIARIFGEDAFVTKTVDEMNRTIEYIGKDNFQLFAVIKFLLENNDIPVICQKLGIFESEYQKVIAIGKSRGYISERGTVSDLGFAEYTRIHDLVTKESESFEGKKPRFKDASSYKPITFRGFK
ncbi:hypothetical protein JJB07_13040 [Tumebacillus sp. ITR2]|uniref:Uncharacterized protein n=1 Tax=Tumebacillus amylolyticus TaxID=2801339 RepID=A0ABS1JBA8_9BACL|nr:hypothetical protein [Tumebacillus amylolyticus]MBL0387565.1 hypothetical protein [Tumebacillus amylolyticus]